MMRELQPWERKAVSGVLFVEAVALVYISGKTLHFGPAVAAVVFAACNVVASIFTYPKREQQKAGD